MKNRHFTVILIVTVLVIFALVGLGCNEIRGGGWIPGKLDGKATFGFRGSCTDLSPPQLETLCPFDQVGALIAVNLQYHDHGETSYDYPVKFRGFIQWAECGNTCFDLDDAAGLLPNEGAYVGMYFPEPWGQFKNDTNSWGTMGVLVVDNGEPGPSNTDSFAIALEGGTFTGYINEGNLEGGNVQVFPE